MGQLPPRWFAPAVTSRQGWSGSRRDFTSLRWGVDIHSRRAVAGETGKIGGVIQKVTAARVMRTIPTAIRSAFMADLLTVVAYHVR